MLKKTMFTLLGVLLLTGLLIGQATAEEVRPLVIRDQGRVEVQSAPDQGWRLVASSRVIGKGGSGRTQEQSVASIHLWSDRIKVTMFEKCTFRYADLIKRGEKSILAFHQDRGMIRVKVDPEIHQTSGFQVKTPQALLAVQGTQFFVRVGEGDPSSGEVPPLDLNYLKDNDNFDVSYNHRVLPANASAMAIGGGSAGRDLLAQATASGNAGYTLIGVMKGSVGVDPDTGSPVTVNAGQTLIIWDKQEPMFLRVDPEFVKESTPDTHIAEVPTMPESGSPPSGSPTGAGNVLNPSAYPSGSSGHHSPPYHSPLYYYGPSMP